MGAIASELSLREDTLGLEFKQFINEGLEDIKNGALYDLEEVFEQLEQRYSC